MEWWPAGKREPKGRNGSRHSKLAGSRKLDPGAGAGSWTGSAGAENPGAGSRVLRPEAWELDRGQNQEPWSRGPGPSGARSRKAGPRSRKAGTEAWIRNAGHKTNPND
jgi:hypothetical protein